MRSLIVSLCILVLIIGCEGEQGPAGPTLSGDIEGWVTLYDDLGNRIPDKSGVTISLYERSVSATSDSNGYWQMHTISAGIYDFFFKKENFFTVKIGNIQFVGGGTYYLGDIPIQKVPFVYVTELIASNDAFSNYINFQITTSAPDTVNRRIHILFSNDTISETGEMVEYILSSEPLLHANSVNIQSAIAINDWYPELYGLESGDPLYMIAYVLPIREGISIVSNYNSATKRYELYTDNITLSNVVTVNVP